MPSFLARVKFFDRICFRMKVKPSHELAPPVPGTMRPFSSSLRNSIDLREPMAERDTKEESKDAKTADLALQPLVTPHEKLVRDDRADFSARYHNPYLGKPSPRTIIWSEPPCQPYPLSTNSGCRATH
jgi:hypothetical protein